MRSSAVRHCRRIRSSRTGIAQTVSPSGANARGARSLLLELDGVRIPERVCRGAGGEWTRAASWVDELAVSAGHSAERCCGRG